MMHHKHLCPRTIRSFSDIAALGSNSTRQHIPTATNQLDFSSNITQTLEIKLTHIIQSTQNQSLLKQGQQVHTQLIINGLSNTVTLGSKILGVYVLSASFKDAKNLFYQLDLSYASPWNWMIRGFTMTGSCHYALLFYYKLLGSRSSPDKYTFPYVIKACGGLGAVHLGKSIHRTVALMGYETDVYVASALIKFFADSGRIGDARRVFDKMPQKDGVLWNVMVSGYVRSGDSENVISLFREMRNTDISPNYVTYASVLSVCASEAMLRFGIQLHGLIVRCGLESDPPVANTLLAMYAKCRCFSNARALLNATPQTDLVAWNGMIGGYVQNGFMLEASNLFREMVSAGVKPDSVTFTSLLPSISDSPNLSIGKEIHGYIVKNGVSLDVFLKSALIDVYFKCRDVATAQNLFRHNTAVDVVICTAMMSGYVLNGMNYKALEVFRWLLHEKMRPNAITLASILPACASLAVLKLGKELHGYVLKYGIDDRCYVGSSISDMYAKCGRLDLAYQTFARISEKDTVSWNSMITNCSQNGKPEEAIQFFQQMGRAGANYDCVSISAGLSACAHLPALQYGKEIHGFMVRAALVADQYAESALIDMYAKCGNLESACRVFDTMQGKNEVSWNSIIAAYGNHGRLAESLKLFHEMTENGFYPDHVTFLAVISACGHAGQVDEGNHYFRHMTKDYGITARMEHYTCMVDLFARAGLLNEALEIIRSMPFDPDAGVWGTLLGGCRVYGNVELAELASKHLFKLDPQNSGYYILLSNLQTDAGEKESAARTRNMMKKRGVGKVPGYSWIEVNNATNTFVAADTSHPQFPEIYLLLKNLLLELRREGYLQRLDMPVQPEIKGHTS